MPVLKLRAADAEEGAVPSLLRLSPVRAVAFKLIDAGIFRNALEERLKRDFIVLDASPVEASHHDAVVKTLPTADQAGQRAAGGSPV